MSILSSAMLLASFAVILPPIIGPDISSDLDYKYNNVIDYVCFEPLKRQKNVQISRLKIKVSFRNKLNDPGLVKVMVFTNRYPQGVELKTWNVSKKFQTLEFDYMQTATTIFDKQDNFVINLVSDYGEDEVHIDMPFYEYTNFYVQNENQTWTTAKNICLYKPDIGVTFISESLVVRECVSDIYLNPGEPLNLDFFYFSYFNDASMSLNPYNTRMYIHKVGEHFRNFGTYIPELDMIEVPMKMTKKVGSSYKFDKSETYYVDPSTYEMSTRAINGYSETNELYFPNTTKEEETYLVILAIESLGCNSNPFHYEFNVHTGRKIFGNCQDYEYCLNTRDAEADSTLGTIISR